MYDELVKRLRDRAKRENDYYEHGGDIINEAADAIEELWKKYLASEVDATNLTGWLAEEHAKHLWIPVTERLPEEDKEVLISYRYKEGEGDMSHVEVDITTYGQMYFGGNKVGNYKHWRAPFEYFESNYEVIAWMPLPKPPKEE